jgi:hypothetical protein
MLGPGVFMQKRSMKKETTIDDRALSGFNLETIAPTCRSMSINTFPKDHGYAKRLVAFSLGLHAARSFALIPTSL